MEQGAGTMQLCGPEMFEEFGKREKRCGLRVGHSQWERKFQRMFA